MSTLPGARPGAVPTDVDPFSDHRHRPGSEAPLSGAATALLVIDLVRDFVDPDGAMPLPGADALAPAVNGLVAAVRSAGGRVIWVRDEHADADDAEFRVRTPHCLAGTGGSDLAAAYRPEPGDDDLVKHRYSAFFGTDLLRRLTDAGTTTVVVCGVVTNICVRSTVHDAFFSGFEVVVPADGCMATGPREQASTLYDIATHFGQVTTCDDVARRLVRAGAGAGS